VERHHTATAYVVSQGHTLLLWHNFLRMWLPPGGHSEVNEHPVETAIREAKEETSLTVEIIAQNPILISGNPKTIEAPRVILLENIDREDQPPHQHIDHVYFSVPTSDVSFEEPIPHGPSQWIPLNQLENNFSLIDPSGRSVIVAEDVRLLGIEAIKASGYF
tara:strand:+ start:1269 stop:1754 length:486 start_codon:yes stop_codon:yes gene_type:complete